MEGLSEECLEEQLNTEYNYFPVCKDDPIIKEMYQSVLMETLKLFYELECQTDENGDLCPIALSTIFNNYSPDVLVLDDTFYDEITSLKKFVTILKSEKCKSQYVTSNDNYVKINKTSTSN
ncbi:hypothetical protein BCR32DRAFT_282767 [Anaeromyces robustus]|uniref:Uncharacterized protein n=1 Tax=Anaeromyces robustus TaxID=1754192 RepID=A0A1Y1WXG4_9FUNG|nr:hypothetical protein BCR32DRAFT_282767 [Anaeromyces robustus]|eukprot:ORX77896.1 hypothetical protein BCR32DRAFT_282767 [Anaeromyces robustus]